MWERKYEITKWDTVFEHFACLCRLDEIKLLYDHRVPNFDTKKFISSGVTNKPCDAVIWIVEHFAFDERDKSMLLWMSVLYKKVEFTDWFLHNEQPEILSNILEINYVMKIINDAHDEIKDLFDPNYITYISNKQAPNTCQKIE